MINNKWPLEIMSKISEIGIPISLNNNHKEKFIAFIIPDSQDSSRPLCSILKEYFYINIGDVHHKLRISSDGLSKEMMEKMKQTLSLLCLQELFVPVSYPKFQVEKHRIAISNSFVKIDDVEVIGARADKTREVFDILCKQFLEDMAAGRPACKFKEIPIRILANKINWDEINLRKGIERLRKRIQKLVKKKQGIEVGNNDIIQNLKWKGYRINPKTVTICSE